MSREYSLKYLLNMLSQTLQALCFPSLQNVIFFQTVLLVEIQYVILEFLRLPVQAAC